jgi:phage terminase large subunit-like protein
MVQSLLRTVDRNVAFRAVHARRGKAIRAEPVVALTEQGRLHLVGNFPDLEDQLVQWSPDSGPSPDRLDAMVWSAWDWCCGLVRIASPGRARESSASISADRSAGHETTTRRRSLGA